ncbi:MAG: PucR family transcriptional regulator [Caulobacteraceae bacterium]
MRYNELIGILHEKYQINKWNSNDSPVIMDIRLLDRNEHQWDEHVLFVGSLEQLKAAPDRPIMILCTDDNPALPEGSSYALINKEDLYDLFNTAKDLVFEDLREGGMFFELAHMALSGKSIAGVINTAASLLGNALILVDLSQKVLAHSTNYEIVDPLWAQNVERGYCSYEFVQKVRSNKDMKEWSKQGSETQIITLPGDLQPKLVARITQEGHVVGAVIMVEHHTAIGRNHMRQLPLVGRILFDIFSRDSASEGTPDTFYSAILYNLLDEEEISDTIDHIVLSRVDFPSEMRVVVARFVHRIENRYLKRTFSMELERIFPNGHSVQYKSYIGILVPSVSERQSEELAKLARLEDVSIGLSWPFSDIVQFKRYFNQAVASIKLAQRFGQANRVFGYSDFYYYDLLYNYTGKIPLEYYCHPALQVLLEYDKANNSELYITLRTYLEHKNNLKETADALFIHRNTLIYRINRINQLTSLNLDNVSVVYSLMDSFRIEAFLNK